MSGAVVHVIDDDEEMRNGVARLLRAHGHEVRTYPSAGDFLLAPARPAAGCLVLDLQMPGPSGLDLQEALARHPVALPVVFLTGHGDIASGVRAMKMGAVDFLTKPVDPAALLGAVEAALERDRAASARRAEAATLRERHARLTGREREVFAHVVAGEPNKVVARALGITERTVKMHRAQVMGKLGASSVADLVRAAQLLAADLPTPATCHLPPATCHLTPDS
jgi:FixJ family two-component response regulator